MNDEPRPTVEDLLAALRQGGAETDEAVLALGILIEDRAPADDIALMPVVGEQIARRRLSPREHEAAVDGLLAYLQDAGKPHPMAVWALAKSYELRTVPTLINLLDRHAADPRTEKVAYQALLGLVTAGVNTGEYRESALAAIQRAADRGLGEVAETARRFLETAQRGARDGAP
jgi:hypothetical protein